MRLGEFEDVLIAPREALEKDGDEWFVTVKAPSRDAFERRSIEVETMTDTHVAIAQGLQEGEEVALEPLPSSEE